MLRIAATKPSVLFSGFLFTKKTFFFSVSYIIILSYFGLNTAVLSVTASITWSLVRWLLCYLSTRPGEEEGESQVLSLSYGVTFMNFSENTNAWIYFKLL